MVKLRWFVLGSERIKEFAGLLEAMEYAVTLKNVHFEVDTGDGWVDGVELYRGLARLFAI